MALRDQPYLPLYVLDFLVDEKLAYCSAESTGVYIRLMCILAPLITMTKGEVVHAGLSLKAPYHLTWSCYEGGDTPCGECATCIDRARAFAENGVADPALTPVKQSDGVTRLEHRQKLSDIHFGFDLQLYSNGDYNYWRYSNSIGVRPALTLSPSLLVSVECDEEEEVESKWHEYLEYLIHWAISHSDKGFAGCMPACYNEWLALEGGDAE